MSLASRVRAAEGNRLKVADEPLRGLGTLKAQVRSIVSMDDIALIARDNPLRARSELKRACAQVFEDACWALTGDAQREKLVQRFMDETFGMGPLEPLLADDSITEIMINGPNRIFYERDGKIFESDQMFADIDQLRALIDRILGPLGRRVDEASPLVNARLPEGHRVHVAIPPLALEGPVVTIRKFSRGIITLNEMHTSETLEPEVVQLFIWAVLARKNLAVSGGTGSGKTTLLNALSAVVPATERIITIEDSAELRFLTHPHVVRLEARPRNAEGFGEITIRDLVINALRMRPDRIIVGECRAGEALDMLQAMTTGHDGSLTTLHANSPADAVARLTTMVRYAVDLPVDVIESTIASAFDLVIQTSRALDGRRYVSHIAQYRFDVEKRLCQTELLYERNSVQAQGCWYAEPVWIEEVVKKTCATRGEVKAWRQRISILQARLQARLA
ncbi:CpaF family protein [Eggerthellaceae bacterium 3-80]|nr:CpaF family protein [bacterium D16-34]